MRSTIMALAEMSWLSLQAEASSHSAKAGLPLVGILALRRRCNVHTASVFQSISDVQVQT